MSGSDNEVDTKMDQVEEKKGRGRQKKAKTDEKSNGEPPVKRGRGRPPKADSTAKAATSKAKKTKPDEGNGVEAAAKPRGRKPKAAPKQKEPEPEPEAESEEEESEPEEKEPAPPAKKNGKAASQKAAKNGHAKDVEESEEDEEGSTASTDSKIKIVVEHCKSCQTYRRKADEIIDALKEKWSNIEVEYNPSKPRKGAFEFTLIGSNGSDVSLYSGIDLGPPRKEKFPNPSDVVESMEKAYVANSA